MKVTSIYVPNIYLKNLKLIEEKGFYGSRSAIIRHAIAEFLIDEEQLIEDVDTFLENK